MATPAPDVSVIVPALNEAAGIASTLASVRRQEGSVEVVVVDGGSDDGTAEAARAACPEATVLAAPRGRAAQMNAGAALASGSVLLFLHADTCLPDGALAAVRGALADSEAVGGCFRTAFDVGSEGRFGTVMRLWEARLWMGWHRLAFGDRALFFRRSAFEAMGGFPDQPLFEDLDAVRAARRLGRFVFLPASVTTSARRFRQHGAVGQQARNLALWAAWNAGVAPDRLARFYGDDRASRG